MCAFNLPLGSPFADVHSTNSQHQAGLFKIKAWVARLEIAPVAVAQIYQKIHFPFAIGKEFGIDFRRVESGHWSTIQSQGPRGENEIPCLQRTVAECGFITKRSIAGEHGTEVSLRK